MRISVVIPVYNGEPFLPRCLASVWAQTAPPAEVIVVNDGSTDGTRAWLEAAGPRLRALHVPHAGRSAARNRGIEAAGGDYVAFLDADDEFLPGHLAQLAAAARRTGAELVHDACRMPYLSDRENLALLRRRAADSDRDLFARYHFPTPNAMVNRAWVRDRRLAFDTRLEIGEDMLFFLSLLLLGARRVFVPEFGTRIGIHAGNTTRDPRETYRRGAAAYDGLDRLIAERGLRPARRLRAALAAGRVHAAVMQHVFHLYTGGGAQARRALRGLLLRRHAAARDRARCLLAQCWPAVPFARHPALMRALFGYNVRGVEFPGGRS